jgi:hypothetical protein
MDERQQDSATDTAVDSRMDTAMDTGSGEGVPGTVPPTDGEASMVSAADEIVAAVSDDVPLHQDLPPADERDPDTPVFQEP